MKTKNLFWGFLFLTIGILVFINNFSSIDFYWLNIWEFWPLFLILAGIALLVKHEVIKSVIVCLSAIVLGAAVFSTFKSGWEHFREDVIVNIDNGIHIKDMDESGMDVKIFEEDFSDESKYASLHFKAGAGLFKIKDTTNQLFYAVTKGYSQDFNLSRLDEEGNVKINFISERNGFSFLKRKNKNSISLKLNSNPIWKLDLDVGAAAAEFDLRNYKVEDINIDIGAASLIIKLGEQMDSAKVDIDGGAASIEILIPENTGCEINSDIVLSSRDFQEFKEISDDIYRTDNFESSVKKIYMNIDAGVSSIKIRRYSVEEW
ncbi:MAG: hypothetical protein EHM47_01270 [Ignavibacteriales bacterium]|nr:MAG: hypothetical protein EHM47_01270 [Ignavibacteriales bacterium]